MIIGGLALFLGLAADLIGIGAGSGALGPNQIALAISGAAFLSSGALVWVANELQRILLYTLVGVIALATIFLGDLITIGGVPSTLAKVIVLTAGLVSVGISNITLSDSFETSTLANWRSLLAIDGLRTGKLGLVLLQLILLVAVLQIFNLENQAVYQNIALVTLFGFVFNFVLAKSLRLPYFLLLSIGAMYGLFGLAGGTWMLAIGLILIGSVIFPYASFSGELSWLPLQLS